MNDKKLILSPAPHIRAKTDTGSIMRDVAIAMIPALAWAVYIFGMRALILAAVSVFFSVTMEWTFRRIMKRPQTVGDFSAVVTGMIIAMSLPAGVPLWMVIIADFTAIVIVKQLFGGLGQNFVNPALVGRAVLLFSYSEYMGDYPVTGKMSETVINAAGGLPLLQIVDTLTGPTPLALFSNAKDLPANSDMFMGYINGSMGEICSLALLAGGIYLVARKVISPVIPLSFMGTVMAAAAFRGFDPVFHVCAGSVMFAAIFMATDYTTSPVTAAGKLIYGIGCGILTMTFRIYTSFPEGSTAALLFMNMLTPHIDRITVALDERRFYGRKEGR